MATSTYPQQDHDGPSGAGVPTSGPAGVDGKRRRVLIADDDPDTLELYAGCMREAGWLVSEAVDGLAAVETARAFPPDAIVMDMRMPGLDGLGAVARLRLDARTRSIPVLACSGMDRARAEAQAKEAGCEAFVAKPIHPDVLREALDQITSIRPIPSQLRSEPACTDGATGDGTLSGLQVLVVDQDAVARQVLVEALEAQGALCVAAGTAQDAFDRFVEWRPHVVVSDVWKSDGDRFELIRRIRALAPERGGLTSAVGVSSEANAEQALMAGYHVFLPKPIDVAVLVRTLEEFSSSSREATSAEAPWEIASSAPGRVEMTFAGHIHASDAGAAMAELLQYLDRGPCRLLVDLRRVTGFSAAGTSLAQAAIWPKRHAIVHVTIVGGPLSARVVASAACHLLGIGCTMEGPHER